MQDWKSTSIEPTILLRHFFGPLLTTYEMEEIVEIVRQMGRQQGQNAYYHTCYTLLKKTQDLILETLNKLLDLYHSNAFEEPESVSTIADDLRNDIYALIAREGRARSQWDEFFEK